MSSDGAVTGRTVRRAPAAVLLALALAPGLAAPAAAADYLLFQHGGAGTAQAGALTARGGGAAAVHYNPAALVGSPRQPSAEGLGFRVQLGLDFTAPRDEIDSSLGDHAADHVITLAPALYASWRLPAGSPDLAFGIGIDTELWHIQDWDTALFPARFRTRRQEVTLFDVHPVVAYGFSERWSVGLGGHYYRGTLGFGDNRVAEIGVPAGTFGVEVERLAEVDADGAGFDLSLHYAGEGAGWGLVYESGAEVSGTGDATYEPRDVPPDPALRQEVAARFGAGDAELGFEVPARVRTGTWWAPYPELRLELDAEWTEWSSLGSSTAVYRPEPFTGRPEGELVRPRRWDDTVSLHLGAEGDLGEHWLLSGGLAWVPSPVPMETLEPGFPRGDSLVYALGIGYRHGEYRIDLGYSFHDVDDVTAAGQVPAAPGVEATYSSRNQVFAFSVSRDLTRRNGAP